MEENNCKFICSQGFRKSSDIFSLKNTNNYMDDINFNNFVDNYLIYIKTDYLKNFYVNLDKLKNKIILIIGSSDYTIPNDVLNNYDFEKLLNNKYIVKIYAENCIYKHDKIINLPIGLDYHTMYNNHIYWGSKKTPLEQEIELLNIRNIMKPFGERQLKIYSNCHFFISSKFGNDRKTALKEIPNHLLFLEPIQIDRKTSQNNQINYSFVLSPHGNGLDCHRTWEALALGCIPIVKTSPLDSLYNDLPILIVKEWSDVTQELLNKTIEEYKTKQFNLEKLKLNYWIKKINNYKI